MKWESRPKNDALQAEKGEEVCQVEGWGIREAELDQKRGAVDEGVTERKLEASKGKWEGAGDEGIVSCHHCFVPQLLYVTCNQTDQGFL